MSDESTEGETKYCCISHEFFRVASANPNKIAVIHASGVAQLSRELREKFTSSNFDGNIVELLDKRVESLSPPVYAGDSCYTYSDLLKAVHSLSSRLRSIQLGVDDPNLIRPEAQGSLYFLLLSFLYLKSIRCLRIANITGGGFLDSPDNVKFSVSSKIVDKRLIQAKAKTTYWNSFPFLPF